MPPFYLADRFTACKKAIARTILLVSVLFFSSKIMAQRPEYTRSYLNNVVEVGLGDFGLITAEDSASVYFIAVRRAQAIKDYPAEKIANSIKLVKFYGNTYKTKATKVSESRIGAFTLVLYQATKPPTGDWQRSYFSTLAYKKGKYSTFRDKWLSDKIWAVMEAKMEVIKQPKAGIATVEVPLEAGIAKGMPMVNNEGFIAGMFAESTLGKKVVKVINMKEIADALYVAGGNSCRYFHMIEFGKTDIRCELEMQAKIDAEEDARLTAAEKAKKALGKQPRKHAEQKKDTTEKISIASVKPEPKKHFIDYGLNGNILFDPMLKDNPNKDNDFNTRVFHLGLSLYLNIDKKKGNNRITLKPRYGNFAQRNDDGLWTSPDDEVRIVKTSYSYVEMPVILERRLFKTRKYSVAIGAGYSAGVVFGHKYQWIDKAVTSITEQSVPDNGSAITQRLIGELHFYEFKFGRLTAVYSKDISAYPHANYKLYSNGTDYTPFADKKKSWYVGLELGIRLRGSFLR
jgi:hypothetical protein